jgi:hypothetical protein
MKIESVPLSATGNSFTHDFALSWRELARFVPQNGGFGSE